MPQAHTSLSKITRHESICHWQQAWAWCAVMAGVVVKCESQGCSSGVRIVWQLSGIDRFFADIFSTWNTYQDLKRTILNHKLKIWWSYCHWVGNFWWVEGPHNLDLSSWEHVEGFCCVTRLLDPYLIDTIMCQSWTIFLTKLGLIIIFWLVLVQIAGVKIFCRWYAHADVIMNFLFYDIIYTTPNA